MIVIVITIINNNNNDNNNNDDINININNNNIIIIRRSIIIMITITRNLLGLRRFLESAHRHKHFDQDLDFTVCYLSLHCDRLSSN